MGCDAGEYNAVHACGSVLAAIHTLPAGSCRAVGTTNLHEYMCSRRTVRYKIAIGIAAHGRFGDHFLVIRIVRPCVPES